MIAQRTLVFALFATPAWSFVSRVGVHQRRSFTTHVSYKPSNATAEKEASLSSPSVTPWWKDTGARYENWLRSSDGEQEQDGLRVEGTLPSWLQGDLVHVGPALFEIGGEKFRDWVDGQAMLYQVGLSAQNPDTCFYRNRFLDSFNLRTHRAANKIATREPATRPEGMNFIQRLQSFFAYSPQQNANLHVSELAGRQVCMSVSCIPMEFSSVGLETVGPIPFEDELSQTTPIFYSEPHVHRRNKDWYSAAITLNAGPTGLQGEYVLFRVASNDSASEHAPAREVIARFPSAGEWPSPVHNIAITEHYAIVIEVPYALNIPGVLRSEAEWLFHGSYEGSLSDYTTWDPSLPTVFHVIDLRDGSYVASGEHPAFFFFHVANAFEEKSDDEGKLQISIDLSAYGRPPSGFDMRDAHLGNMDNWSAGGGRLTRFSFDIPLEKSEDQPKVPVKSRKLSPVICDEVVTCPHGAYSSHYKNIFGIIDGLSNRLGKVNIQDGSVLLWKEQIVGRHQAWQPVFVSRPGSTRLDDGVVLCIVRDLELATSFVSVFNPTTMEEMARVWLPSGHHIAMHAHGHFFFHSDQEMEAIQPSTDIRPPKTPGPFAGLAP